MKGLMNKLAEEEAHGVTEYAVMLAVVLAVVVATLQLIGLEAKEVFFRVGNFPHR